MKCCSASGKLQDQKYMILEKSDDEMNQVHCTSSLFDKSIEYTISNAWK